MRIATAGSRRVPGRASPTAIYLITASAIMNNTLIVGSLPEILDGLGADARASGLVVAAGTLPGIVVAPIVGMLADRYGRRELLVPCLVIFGVAGSLGALAPTLGWLIILRLLQGTGAAGLGNLAVALAGDSWEGTRRRQVLGRNAAIMTGGLAAFPVLGGVLTDLFTWRLAYLVYAIALPTAWYVSRRLPRGIRSDVSLRGQVQAVVPVLRTPRFLTLCVISAVSFALVMGVFFTVLPIYVEARFDASASTRGLLLGLPALAMFITSVNNGRIREQQRARAVLLTAGLGLAAAFAAVAVAPSMAWVLVGMIPYGVGQGLLTPTIQDLAAGAPGHVRGATVATVVASNRVGQSAGPVAFASLASAIGPRPTFAVAAGIAAALGVVVWTFAATLSRNTARPIS